jgi:predicted RNA polymerase sigma factor
VREPLPDRALYAGALTERSGPESRSVAPSTLRRAAAWSAARRARFRIVHPDAHVHTASDIPLSAYARDPEAWLPFVGTYSNVDVFFKIARVLSK